MQQILYKLNQLIRDDLILYFFIKIKFKNDIKTAWLSNKCYK